MTQITVNIIVFIVWLSGTATALKPDYDIFPERCEPVKCEHPNDDYVDFTYLKFEREKRNFFVNGNFSFLQDLDNSVSAGLDTSYSPMGNNQFIKHPFRLPILPFCDYINTTFRNFVLPLIREKSNFPILPPEGICPIPKGSYYVDKSPVKADTFPPHLQRGLWKVEEKFYKDNMLVGGVRFLIKVVDK